MRPTCGAMRVLLTGLCCLSLISCQQPYATPSGAAAVALARDYFPEFASIPVGTPGEAAALDETRALTAQLVSGESLELTTRGLTFRVEQTSAASETFQVKDGVAFAGERHFWMPVGSASQEIERGWRASRIEEAWVLDASDEHHRAEYAVTLPPSVRRIRDTGEYLEFLDEASRPVLRFHPSVVRDAKGQSRDGDVQLAGGRLDPATRVFHVEGAHVRITTTVPLAGLEPPLVVDPGWSSTESMASARGQHAAVLLSTGKLLVANGVNATGFVASAELFDPATGTWSSAGSPGIQGNVASGIQLPDGRALVLTDGSLSGRLYDPETGTWSATGNMSTTRALPTLTLLRSGKVLVAGGSNLDTSELYDPETNTWSLTSASMSMARRAHDATLLQDGRVLVTSGFSSAGEVPGAELYDPVSDSWSLAAPPLVPRHYASATLLPDGRVLVAGGYSSIGITTMGELFDPTANTWTATGSLAHPRNGHSATLLTNGKVLVTGGSDGDRNPQGVSEIYDPATGTWTPAGALAVARENHTATLLPTGQVFIAGGFNANPTTTFFATTELYEPDTARWAPAGAMRAPRLRPALALLPSGEVLAAGGQEADGTSVASAERYQRASNTWSTAAALSTPRASASATVLASGGVLVAGGVEAGNALSSTERYDPAADVWTPTASLAVARHTHSATLLPGGEVLVVGGQSGATVHALVERYDPASDTWTPAAAMATARANHAAVLLPNGKVLVAGGRDGASAALASAEVYDPASDTWTPAASLAQSREGLTLTLLPSGRVMAAAGVDGGSGLASTELYDPVANVWAPGPTLAQARWNHAATLLPSGQLLIAGGHDSPTTFSSTAELYDAARGTWQSAPAASARGGLGAVALPSGEVLLVGGAAGSGFPSAELFEATGSDPAWRPVVTEPDELYTACPSTLRGLLFRGISGAGSGHYNDSSTNFPLVRLRAAEGGRLWTLASTEQTATNATVVVPVETPPGTYGLSVFSNAIPGGRTVKVVRTPTPIAQDASLATPFETPVSITLGVEAHGVARPLAFAIVTPPAHGTLSGTPPSITYTPNAGYEGPDSFTFRGQLCTLASNVATVNVTVLGDLDPEITCPANMEVEASGAEGATVTYPAATATDAETASPTVTYSQDSGTDFPLGTTTVTATVEDDRGNTASCSFEVSVRDTTAPALSCPASVTVIGTETAGGVVSFELPTATDAVTATPTIAALPASGTVFPYGVTPVTVTATDAAGNAAQCSFDVTVQATVVAIAGGGCASTGAGTNGLLLALVIAGLWLGRRRRHAGLIAVGVSLFAAQASAQSRPLVPFDAERLRFNPAATDSLFVDTGHLLPEGGYRLMLLGNYERGTLLLKGSDGTEHPLLQYRAAAWLAGAWSPTERLELSAKLPVILAQGGSGSQALVGVTAPSSFGLGTPEVGARFALLRREDGAPVYLSAGLDIGLPGGTASAFGRQNDWSGLQLAPRLAVGREVGPLALGASVGARIRAKQDEPGRSVGSELEQSLVVATRGKGLRGEVALVAAESLVHPDFALEVLGGVRLPLAMGFELHALAGHGFTDIPGTPSWRAGVALSWAVLPTPIDPCQPGQRHTPAQCPHLDDDGDGVRNGADECPLEAGDVSHRGCPAPAVPVEEKPVVEEPKPVETKPAALSDEAVEEKLVGEGKLTLDDQRVLFPIGEATIQGEGALALDQVATALKKHPNVQVRIEGHTDDSGTETINRLLGQQRANAVRDYLIRQGVKASRLTAQGYGPSRPLVPNDTPENRSKNRRVEFIVVEGGKRR